MSRSDDPTYRAAVSLLGWAGMAFLVFPVLLTIVVSFGGSVFIEFPPQSFSLKWYGNIGQVPQIGRAVLTSLGIALIAASLATAMAIPAALAIARYEFPGRSALVAFLVSPITVPMVAIGIAISQFFVWVGAGTGLAALLVGHLVLISAYPIRTLVASLTLSNPSLEEAAASLGATRWVAFRTVVLPQLMPGLVSGFLFAFLISFDNYPISIFLVKGGITTMPIEIFSYISQNLDPTPAAFSALYILIVSAIIVFAERRFGIVSLSVRG